VPHRIIIIIIIIIFIATLSKIRRAEVGTLAVDWWAVTFGTARRGLGGAAARPCPFSLYQM